MLGSNPLPSEGHRVRGPEGPLPGLRTPVTRQEGTFWPYFLFVVGIIVHWDVHPISSSSPPLSVDTETRQGVLDLPLGGSQVESTEGS